MSAVQLLTDYTRDYEHARNMYSVIYHALLSRFFSTTQCP